MQNGYHKFIPEDFKIDDIFDNQDDIDKGLMK